MDGKERTCPHCGYKWVPRVDKPKKCPLCGRWLPEWLECKK